MKDNVVSGAIIAIVGMLYAVETVLFIFTCDIYYRKYFEAISK